MTAYRLFPSTSGPAAPVSYGGNFLAGVLFEVTQGGMWFEGYYFWCPAGGDTGSQTFALWNVTGLATGTLIPAATATSGTLTAGAWNFVPLASPVPLAIGTTYNACTGWLAVNGFPDSDTSTDAGNSYGAGGHTSGITNGPLFAYSDQGQSKPEPYGNAQGVFSTAGTDPTVHMPASGSASGNFWIDPAVSDTAPPSYGGPYRLWPNKADASVSTGGDDAVCYDIAVEIRLSVACTLSKIWFYSPAGATQLPTACTVWNVPAGTVAAGTVSPSWSGSAGTGWLWCALGAVLPAGTYRAGVFNGASTPTTGWGAKQLNYWDTGAGSAGTGITFGPLYAPNLASASTCYEYDAADGASTPPYTNGLTEPGQSVFSQNPNGGPDSYPQLYVDGLAQNYWIDVEVTPVPVPPPPPNIPPGFASPAAFTAFMPVPQGAPPVQLSGADTGMGADTGSAAVAVPGSDAGAGADTASAAVAVSGADTAAGADDAGGVAAALSGADVATGTDAATMAATLSGADSAAGADTATVAVALSDSDTGTGADTGSVVTAAAPAVPPPLLIPPGFTSPMAFAALQVPPPVSHAVAHYGIATVTDAPVDTVAIINLVNGTVAIGNAS